MSQQFGKKPFGAGLFKEEIANGMEVTLDGNNYLVSRQMIENYGWSIVLLTPTNLIKVYKLTGILSTISVCLLIFIFLGIIYAGARSQEAIRQSEESKRQLLYAAGDGIFGVDMTGQLTFINPAALRMLGFAEEDLLGQKGSRVHDLIHHSHADGSKYSVDDCPMYASYTHGTDHYVTNELLWRKDGSSFPVEYSSMAIMQDDKIMGAVVTFKDITKRKQAEAALMEERRQLQQALDEIKTLRGIVPICSYCKKIRDDEGYWDHVEKYVSAHTDAKFSHGICPTCLEREMKGIETSD